MNKLSALARYFAALGGRRGSGLLALLPRSQGSFVSGQVFLVHFQHAKGATAVATLVITRFAGRLRLRIMG
jgi:hypothetical protein